MKNYNSLTALTIFILSLIAPIYPIFKASGIDSVMDFVWTMIFIIPTAYYFGKKAKKLWKKFFPDLYAFEKRFGNGASLYSFSSDFLRSQVKCCILIVLASLVIIISSFVHKKYGFKIAAGISNYSRTFCVLVITYCAFDYGKFKAAK